MQPVIGFVKGRYSLVLLIAATGCSSASRTGAKDPLASADIYQRDAFGRTALWHAVESSNDETVKSLLDRGSDPNAQDKDGWAPLQVAALNNRPRVCQMLLDRKADPNLVSTDGATALSAAGSSAAKECMKALLKGGADPRRQPLRDWSVLHFAAMWDDVELAELAIQHGASVEVIEGLDGIHPLWTAVRTGPHVAVTLLKHGADPNARNGNSKKTALFEASMGGAAMVRLLLEHGADPSLTDANGITASQHYQKIAKSEGYPPSPEILRLLARKAR
ncbi:MAG: ankyrin repeat domain-containing protein [Armatimonadetes bacterium]|nr:ankyrin repeat domain-containing protein [Armatimonadota bacterium]